MGYRTYSVIMGGSLGGYIGLVLAGCEDML